MSTTGRAAPSGSRWRSLSRSASRRTWWGSSPSKRRAIEIERKRRVEDARAAEAQFRQAERRARTSAEWRLSTDDATAALRLSARYADLVIAGQPEPDEPLGRAFAGELVLGAGRPVLFVPYAGRFADAGKRVMIAWNASREATRAVTDALPILARADSVEVVAFEPGGDHGEGCGR